MHHCPLREFVGAPVRARRIDELVGDLMQTGCQVVLRMGEGIRFGGQL
jgi:hypothetical protein